MGSKDYRCPHLLNGAVLVCERTDLPRLLEPVVPEGLVLTEPSVDMMNKSLDGIVVP